MFTSRSSAIKGFETSCIDNNITCVTSVPDSYLTPLIESIDNCPKISHIPAAREEECLGIAAGAAMSKKRCLVMMQNSGFLNSVGCFSTLIVRYQIPFVCILANRGNIHDMNNYDREKFKTFNLVSASLGLFAIEIKPSDLAGSIGKAFDRAEAGQEAVFILLQQPTI